MSAKASNDFSTHTRRDSCRSNSCVSACLDCVSANRHSVLNCRRSLIRPMIVPHSCAWQKPSRHFLSACAALQRRLALLNVRKSYDCWLKTFWSAKMRLRFRHSIPIPSGPSQNQGAGSSDGRNYLLCKGRDRSFLRENTTRHVCVGPIDRHRARRSPPPQPECAEASSVGQHNAVYFASHAAVSSTWIGVFH